MLLLLLQSKRLYSMKKLKFILRCIWEVLVGDEDCPQCRNGTHG